MDITNDIKKMINQLEKLGKENDYTLCVKEEEFKKLEYIVKNLFVI